MEVRLVSNAALLVSFDRESKIGRKLVGIRQEEQMRLFCELLQSVSVNANFMGTPATVQHYLAAECMLRDTTTEWKPTGFAVFDHD